MHLFEGKFSCLASYYLTGSYRKLCRPVKDAPALSRQEGLEYL